VLESMHELAKEGYDMSPYLNDVSEHSSPESYLDTLRMKVGASISFFEAIKKVEDPMESEPYFKNSMAFSSSGGTLSVTDQAPMRDAGTSGYIDHFQDMYAKTFSDYITEVEQWDPTADEQIPSIKVDISQTDLTHGQELILNSMFPRTDSVLKKIPKIDLLRKEVITWNAINQATAEGLAPTNLAELVPAYLVNIPVNPIDKKPFVFDSKNRTLNKTE